MAVTKMERCGQCPRGDEELECDTCHGSGAVERCVDCHSAIDERDGLSVCFYCDVLGERDPGLEGA